MRSPVLSTWYTLSHSFFFLPTWNWYYNYPDFKTEETEEAKEQVQIPESASCRLGLNSASYSLFCFMCLLLGAQVLLSGAQVLFHPKPYLSVWHSRPSTAWDQPAPCNHLSSPPQYPQTALYLCTTTQRPVSLSQRPLKSASRIWFERCCLYHIVQDLTSLILWQHFRDLTSLIEGSALQALDQQFILLWLLALSCAPWEYWGYLQACLQPRLHSLWHRRGEKA